MESFLNRYRNITVLLLVILAQLVLLSVQVKNDRDVRFIRVWTVTAVSPLAKLADTLRGSTLGVFRNYFRLHDADVENRKLQKEVDQLRMENIFLKNQVSTADRAKALELFQAQVPSKTLAARVISQGLGSGSMVYVDRGSLSGVMRGMGVVTPDGIFGKVMAVYPMEAEVLLVTDPEFAAGVVSVNGQARGTLKGQGSERLCKVDYVAFGDKVEAGDWFYTSGEDRIFPSGFPVGIVKSARPGQPYKEVALDPSGRWRGLEDVLIVMEAVHQPVPDKPRGPQPVYVAPPPTSAVQAAPATPDGATQPAPGGTDADKLKAAYKAAGDAQNHTFGDNLPHSKPPDFTKVGGPTGNPNRTTPPAPALKGTGAPAVPTKGTAPGGGATDDARRANQAAGGGR